MPTIQTQLSQIEIKQNGLIQIKLSLAILNGETVMAEQPYRASISPGENVDATLEAINGAVVDMGYSRLSDADAAMIKSQAAAAHSPAVVEAFAAAQARVPEPPGEIVARLLKSANRKREQAS